MFKHLFVIFIGLISFLSTAKTPLIYGHAYQHDSKILKESRRYMVSLPEGYELSKFSYPTLYIIDGDFQFHHVSNVAKHLARMGKIPPLIVIGVANQGPNDYLASNTWPISSSEEFGNQDNFSSYLRKELMVEIDQSFRTNQYKAISGYSLGGLFVMTDYLDKHSPFGAYLAMSPSLWFDDYRYKNKMSEYFKQENNPEKKLFISLANEEGMGVEEVVELLKENQVTNWQYKKYPNETHYTTALPALYDGLINLFPDYFTDMNELLTMESEQAVIEYFKEKKDRWGGFDFFWLQSYTLSKYFFATQQSEKIGDFLKQAKKLFPDSINELSINFSLGYNKKKQPDKAITLLESIQKANLNNPKWHYQMGLALEQKKSHKKAKQHFEKALMLARKFNLESWEYWELEPYKLKNKKEKEKEN